MTGCEVSVIGIVLVSSVFLLIWVFIVAKISSPWRLPSPPKPPAKVHKLQEGWLQRGGINRPPQTPKPPLDKVPVCGSRRKEVCVG